MWSRAVWLERDQEEEGVIPSSWIREGMVMWPPGVSAAKALRDEKEPQETWRKFRLVKVKHQSENFGECENHDITTCMDTDVDQESEKRQKKKKNFADFITDDHCVARGEVPGSKNNKNPKGKNGSLVLPTPPLKHKNKNDNKEKRSSRRQSSADSIGRERYSSSPEIEPVKKGLGRGRESRSRYSSSPEIEPVKKGLGRGRESRSRYSSSPEIEPVKKGLGRGRESRSRYSSSPEIEPVKKRLGRGRESRSRYSSSPEIEPVKKGLGRRRESRSRYSSSPEIEPIKKRVGRERQSRSQSPSEKRPSKRRSRSRSPSPSRKKSRYLFETKRRTRSKSPAKKKDIYPMENAKFQKRVLFLLADIRQEIKSLRAPNSRVTDCGEILQQMTSMEEFNAMENTFKESTGECHKTQRLSTIGGLNARDSAKKILQKVMSNDLMAKFNMKGQKGKEPFSKSTLCEIVKAAVLKTFQVTEYEVNQNIAAVLKYAPDRRGGGGRGRDAAEQSD